jgi:hypothetical protein
VATCRASCTSDKKAAGGELFSRLAKDRGERRRRTEAGARSRSFVFCALDWRQLSFIQPVYPRQLSLVAYNTPLTPAKKRTPHSRHFRFDSPPNAKPRRSTGREKPPRPLPHHSGGARRPAEPQPARTIAIAIIANIRNKAGFRSRDPLRRKSEWTFAATPSPNRKPISRC